LSKTFYITTAIDYTNAAPHIGHAYEKILADVLVRYHRLKGDDSYFLTGVDQHGQKVQQAAAKEGISPEEFVTKTTAKFIDLWEKLEISYDGWAATTDPLHKTCVQKILQDLYDRGDIYKAKYRGFYSVRQEQFLTDKERGEDGNFGPEWGEVVELEEENWYFRLGNYRDWLLQFLDSHPGCVQPAFRQTELRNAAERLGGDLSISRPKSRLAWGIELPFDTSCVTYVWFDALVNYISFAGYLSDDAKFRQLWPALHVIGKDIIIPAHGIYWLAMLKAMGFADEDMPRFLVHGYVLVDGEKMSKSLGNIRDPHTFADTFGVESLRYFLMRDCVVGQDMDFTDQRLVQRYNVDLANSLGNLLNRTLNMAKRYRQGKLVRSESAEISAFAAQTVKDYTAALDQNLVHQALEIAWSLATRCNAFVEESAPWKLAKDPEKAPELDTVLYTLAESLRILAILIDPVLPKASHGILDQLAVSGEIKLADTAWGGLPDGHVLGEPQVLFPRIEAAAE
jgi:methionyl-tRNA synthetase